jgi:hypothetical protein
MKTEVSPLCSSNAAVTPGRKPGESIPVPHNYQTHRDNRIKITSSSVMTDLHRFNNAISTADAVCCHCHSKA